MGESERRRTGNRHSGDVPLKRVEIDKLAERPGSAPNDRFGTHIDLEQNGNGSHTKDRERQRHPAIFRVSYLTFFCIIIIQRLCLDNGLFPSGAHGIKSVSQKSRA